jgi:hypothetical protein
VLPDSHPHRTPRNSSASVVSSSIAQPWRGGGTGCGELAEGLSFKFDSELDLDRLRFCGWDDGEGAAALRGAGLSRTATVAGSQKLRN